MPEGFFYAPDPSSQLACTIAGNIGMNSGGAHCLKYGVTVNNILGATLVLMDGTILQIGGPALDASGLDLLGLIIGSEGQLGIVTEACVRLLRAAEGARPVLFGFDSSEDAGASGPWPRNSKGLGSGRSPPAAGSSGRGAAGGAPRLPPLWLAIARVQCLRAYVQKT
jgi:FAD/FMN-containing dehydrogenase